MKTETIATASITSTSKPAFNNWQKSYHKCPLCGSQNTEVDWSCVLTTYPCQSLYHCKDCNAYFYSNDLQWVTNDHKHYDLDRSQPYTPSYPTGWVCPKCGAVMSPTQTTCIYCTPAWTPTVTYETGGSICGNVDPNITIKGTITLDENDLKELLKNNTQGQKK